jgi:hypothetical protein
VTCRTLLRPDLQPGAVAPNQLVSLWTELLIGGAIFAVVDDPARPHPENIEAFGVSVFVRDDFAETFATGPRPYLSAIVYEQMLNGRSPVLSASQIREANSSAGLSLVVLHFCMRHPDMSSPRIQEVLHAGSSAFYFCHAGYQLNLLLHEVYGEQHATYMSAGGFRLLTDFKGAAISEHMDTTPANHPFLFIMRKEWIQPAAVHQLSFLFHAPPPRLGFSEGEQTVLLRALLNESDVQIAAALGVPLDKVKKIWRRTYQRVERVAPYLLDSVDQAGIEAHRGAEKRRHLIEYLRSHLEELRPYRSG